MILSAGPSAVESASKLVPAGFVCVFSTFLAAAALSLALSQDAQRVAESAPPSANLVEQMSAAANNPKLSATVRRHMALKTQSAKQNARLAGARPRSLLRIATDAVPFFLGAFALSGIIFLASAYNCAAGRIGTSVGLSFASGLGLLAWYVGLAVTFASMNDGGSGYSPSAATYMAATWLLYPAAAVMSCVIFPVYVALGRRRAR